MTASTAAQDIPLASTTGIGVGDYVFIERTGTNEELVRVEAVGPGTIRCVVTMNQPAGSFVTLQLGAKHLLQKLAQIINTPGDPVAGRFGPGQSDVISATATATATARAGALAHASFVVSPEAENLHHSEVVEDLVDQPVLDVDPARIGAGQVTNQFLKGRRSLIRILSQSGEQEFRLGLETGSRQLFRILLGLPCKDNPPTHQRSSGAQASTGVDRPLRIDSRIPGIESKWSVS